MKLPSTFWTQARRVLESLFAGDARGVAEASALIERIAAAPLAEQHRPVSQFISLLARMPNARERAFALGRQIPVTAYGDLALGLKIAPTFDHVLRVIAKHHHREAPLSLYTYSRTLADGRFGIGFRCPVDQEGEAFLVAAIVAMLERELWHMTGRSGYLKALQLTASSSGWEQAYQRHGFVAPTVGHETNTIVIDRAALDHPNPIADPDTFKSAVAEYERNALLRDAGTSPAVRVTELVMARIAKPPSLDTLAGAMHLSRRQLRLALTRESTTYQEIVQRCRVEYASALLRNPALTISQIADRLGYADVSAFTHGFTKWTGKSPSRFRAEMAL